MGKPNRLFAVVAGATVMAAASAHALVVHFDPPMFNFYVKDPSFGSLDFALDTVEVHPLPGGYGYVFGPVDWVGFGVDGETLTFGAGQPGGYQLVAESPVWDVTELSNSPQGYEVTFPSFISDPKQIVPFVNPVTGQVVDVTITVPEPASWTLMLAGIGSLGAALRYRRRSAAAAA